MGGEREWRGGLNEAASFKCCSHLAQKPPLGLFSRDMHPPITQGLLLRKTIKAYQVKRLQTHKVLLVANKLLFICLLLPSFLYPSFPISRRPSSLLARGSVTGQESKQFPLRGSHRFSFLLVNKLMGDVRPASFAFARESPVSGPSQFRGDLRNGGAVPMLLSESRDREFRVRLPGRTSY